MAVVAQLLGPPLVTREGVVYAPPRGKKVWAVLAYLALAEQPPTRQVLASLLFPVYYVGVSVLLDTRRRRPA